MPINLTFDPASRLIVYDVSGETTIDDWREATKKAFESTGGTHDLNVLIDVRNHKSVASSQFIWELASRFPSETRIKARWAIVFTRVVSEGISNMISTLVRDSGVQVRAFKDRDEALTWLKGAG